MQVEADLLNFQQETINDSTDLQSLGVFFFNAKFGIHKRMDVEVLSGTFLDRKYVPASLKREELYLPDLLFRYKLNIMGNDEGSTAVAIMPTVLTTNFFKEPLAVKNGQLLINAEKDLDGKYGLGYTGGLSSFSFQPFLSRCEFFSTVSFDYMLVGELRHFVEISYRYNQYAPRLHTYSFDSGITYTLEPNMQFDLGFYFFLPSKPFLFVGGTFRI